MKTPRFRDQFPIIAIGCLSALGLIDNWQLTNIPMLLVSILGFVTVALYYKQHHLVSLLVKIWMIAQIPYIEFETSGTWENGMFFSQTWTIWHTSQFFNLHFGLNLGSLTLEFNPIPLLYLGVYHSLRASSLVGHLVHINPGLKRPNKLGKVFPMEGAVIDFVKMGDKSRWLVIELEKDLVYANKSFQHVLALPRDSKHFKEDKRQLAMLLLVPSKLAIENLPVTKKSYLFVDYAGTKFTKKQ